MLKVTDWHHITLFTNVTQTIKPSRCFLYVCMFCMFFVFVLYFGGILTFYLPDITHIKHLIKGRSKLILQKSKKQAKLS